MTSDCKPGQVMMLSSREGGSPQRPRTYGMYAEVDEVPLHARELMSRILPR
jgi:hypothetical protein